MDVISWTILTYETTSGVKPVDIFIKKQQPQARSKIIHNVRLLQQYGNRVCLMQKCWAEDYMSCVYGVKKN